MSFAKDSLSDYYYLRGVVHPTASCLGLYPFNTRVDISEFKMQISALKTDSCF